VHTFNRYPALILIAPVGYLFWAHWPIITGQFLSDTFSHIYNCYDWSQNQQLGQKLAALFLRSINEEGGADMYRPLGIASYCLDYMLWVVEPYYHKITQLLFHIFNGLLFFVLVQKVTDYYKFTSHFALIATALYLLSPLSPEVSSWVATRFDVLVQTFMLLALYSAWCYRRVWTLLFLVFALLSKESAIVIIPMLVSLSWFRQSREFSNRIIQTLKDSWLYIALLLVYLLFRLFVFGQATDVYVKDLSLFDRFIGNALQFPTTLQKLAFGPFHGSLLSILFMSLVAVLILLSLWHCMRTKTLNIWFFIFSSVSLVLLALITQFSSTDKSGGGARVLYILIPWLCGLVSLPILSRTGVTYKIVLVCFFITSLIFHNRIIKQWNDGAQLSALIMQNVPAVAVDISEDDWTLLLIPEHLGAALLGRNAQGGYVLPPFQNNRYLDSIVPFIWSDLELWRNRINEGFVVTFKENSMSPNPSPKQVFCIQKNGTFVGFPITYNELKSSPNWLSFWRNAIKSKGCYQ